MTPETFPATTDLAEIAARMRRLFAERGMQPKIESDATHFAATFAVREREIDGGPYVIDRRRPRPQHVIPTRVPDRNGYELRIERTDYLPQIMTQYFSPPSPRGGLLVQFVNNAPDGRALSTRTYFSPEARGTGPYLVVQLDVGPAAPHDLVDAVLDRIAPLR